MWDLTSFAVYRSWCQHGRSSSNGWNQRQYLRSLKLTYGGAYCLWRTLSISLCPYPMLLLWTFLLLCFCVAHLTETGILILQVPQPLGAFGHIMWRQNVILMCIFLCFPSDSPQSAPCLGLRRNVNKQTNLCCCSRRHFQAHLWEGFVRLQRDVSGDAGLYDVHMSMRHSNINQNKGSGHGLFARLRVKSPQHSEP